MHVKNLFSNVTKAIDMTTGNIRKIIISFTLPIMIGNLFQQMYNMVDTSIVGRGVGSAALASVVTTSPVVQLLLGLIIGMTSGMSVIIAQYVGSKNEKDAKKAICNGIFILAIITISVTILGILFCRNLFIFIHTPSELIDDAVLYTIITFTGTISTAAYNYESGVLRAYGNSIIPLLFLILTSILNVILDLLFVLVFHWGIAGAAIATVLSQTLSAIFCFVYLIQNSQYFSFQKDDWIIDKPIIKQHLQTGIPMAFFSSLLAISFLILQSALNSLGSNDMAAYTAASKMDTLIYQILGAFGTSISTFAAQNYGKKQFARINEGVKESIKITIAISIGMTLFVFLFGKYFMMLFIDPQETEIFNTGLQYMKTTSLFYIILGFNYVLRFSLTGVGKTIIPMMVGITEVLTRAAVTYFLVYQIGFFGMTLASPSCWFTSTLLCMICYKPMMKTAFEQKK